MANDSSWTCPYCRQIATIRDDNFSNYTHFFDKGNKQGLLGLETEVIICPNSMCNEFTIIARHYQAKTDQSHVYRKYVVGNPMHIWNLKPQSSAKPFPDYIPLAIRQDYEEACLVCTLSPKASATLSRRCLQGMIRDFWEISKPRLIDEIRELHGKIDDTTWQAIDAVRSMGNIGAHMEKDINLIVDVDQEESDLLLRLIEVLMEEWYIRRHERNEHMNKVITAAQAKISAKGKASP